MKKIFSRLIAITLSLGLILSMSNMAFAKTAEKQAEKAEKQAEKAEKQAAKAEKEQKPENLLFEVEFKTEKEQNDFLTALDEYNKQSEESWANALKQSKEENLEEASGRTDTISAASFSQANCGTSVRVAGVMAYIGAYTTYDRLINGTVATFGSIYNVVVYGQNGTTIGNTYTQWTKIDTGRTLAVNASCLVGVKTYTGDYQYYPATLYIEFFAKTNTGTMTV